MIVAFVFTGRSSWDSIFCWQHISMNSFLKCLWIAVWSWMFVILLFFVSTSNIVLMVPMNCATTEFNNLISIWCLVDTFLSWSLIICLETHWPHIRPIRHLSIIFFVWAKLIGSRIALLFFIALFESLSFFLFSFQDVWGNKLYEFIVKNI